MTLLHRFSAFIILGLIFLSAAGLPQSMKKDPPKDSHPKADYGKFGFSLVTLDGKKISLADYSGKTVLVNIWAPWCGPCKKEAPGFASLYKEFHTKGFEIVSVAVQTTETDVRSFLSAFPMTWPVGIKDDVAIAYRTYGLPDNYLFKPDGSIAKHFIGYTSEDALRPLLQDLTAKSK